MTIERITTSTYSPINLEDYEPIGKRKFRFKYDGSWTRWFNDDDDLSWLTNVLIDEIEMTETVQKKKK